jgi:hypothetical protein
MTYYSVQQCDALFRVSIEGKFAYYATPRPVTDILGGGAMLGQCVAARRLTQALHGRQINHARAGLIEINIGER